MAEAFPSSSTWAEFYEREFGLEKLKAAEQAFKPSQVGPHTNQDADIDRINALFMTAAMTTTNAEYRALFAAVEELAKSRSLPAPNTGWLRGHTLQALRAGFYSTDEVLAIIGLTMPSILAANPER